MKRNFERSKVETDGVSKNQKFQVEASAEAFSLISDSLYSRSIEAIVRELGCNAYDSHVENGNPDEPFDVKLPTRMDDEFYIEDYGVGLTNDEIYNLYTVVFKSDKTDTDDATGCFGVGSKSPFAYTNQFTVESIVDGEKWIYTVYLDEEGIPNIAEMVDEPVQTSAQNGVKIKFNVKRQDQQDFVNAAKKVFKFFDTKPNIIGYSIDLERPEPHVSGDGWELHSRKVLTESYAVMGNVCYRIDQHEVDAYIPGTYLFFELSEMSPPAASREELKYTQKTVSSLEKRYAQIKDELTQKIEKEIEGSDSYLEACVKWKNMKGNSIIARCVSNPKYNGRALDISRRKRIEFFDKREKDQVRKYRNTSEANLLTNSYSGNFKIDLMTSEWNSSSRQRTYHVADEDIVLINADRDHAKWSRSKYYSKNNPNKLIYVVSVDDQTKFTNFKKELEVIDSDLEVVQVSNLPDPPKKSRKKPTDKADADWLKFDKSKFKGANMRQFWGLSELPKEGTYVLISRYKWSNDEDNINKVPFKLKKKLKKLKKFGFENIPVYGIKKRYHDEIKDEEGWVKLEDRLESFAKFMYDELSDAFRFANSIGGKRKYPLYMLAEVMSKGDLDDPKLQEMSRFLCSSGEDIKANIIRLLDLQSLLAEFCEDLDDDSGGGDEFYTFQELKDEYRIFYDYANRINFKPWKSLGDEDVKHWVEYFNSIYNHSKKE